MTAIRLPRVAIDRIEGRALAGESALPTIGIVLAVTSWGFGSALLKMASISGPTLAFYRLWLGVLALGACMIIVRQPLAWRTMRFAAPAGVVFALNMLLFMGSIQHTTVANTTLIGALQPAMVLVVAGPLFGEVVGRREIACVAAAIGGLALFIAGASGAPQWSAAGDLMAVAAVVAFTGYFLISKQARASINTLEYMVGVHLAAAIVVTPFALANPGDLGALDRQDIAIVLFFAFVSGTVGQMLVGWAHAYVDVTVSSLLLLGVPVVAAMAAWLMLDEPLGALQVLGGGLTIAALAVIVRRPASTARIEPVGPMPDSPAGRPPPS
jgi:drug/metabolite transporter (DMT)-like permease